MFESHFQSFDDPAPGLSHAARLSHLRDELRQQNLDGFIVPRADRYQNEYVPPSEERLAWISGFTGSAGAALIGPTRAALLVDGRYRVQAAQQVGEGWDILALDDEAAANWLKDNLVKGQRIGFDPWLHTKSNVEKWQRLCATIGVTCLATQTNPIDVIWNERPAPPRAPVSLHPTAVAGHKAADKIALIQSDLDAHALDGLIVSDPHAAAWLFNIRGGDVAHTPLPLCEALVTRDAKPVLFIASAKLDDHARKTLHEDAEIASPDALPDFIARLGHRRIGFDTATLPQAVHQMLIDAGAEMVARDPIALRKAIKNETEIAGARAAHQRDGAAMATFLAWLAREAPGGNLTEIDAVEALETFRRQTGEMKDISFPTIAGSGPNGAIVHYRVTRASNRRIASGELFLIDSGAQYRDGTTDITRTVAIGVPSPLMRDRFTRVLKGHIAIARAIFPEGTSGAQIDALARQFLWRAGLDYDHGTGHGVGSYLSVHEGPARISKLGHVPLQSGMILSNEPGYYKEGAFGIRIENLVLVRGADIDGAEKDMLAFETLTLAPIDRALIDIAMLDKDEREWIDAYHARVNATLGPLVNDGTRAWLGEVTQPL